MLRARYSVTFCLAHTRMPDRVAEVARRPIQVFVGLPVRNAKIFSQLAAVSVERF